MYTGSGFSDWEIGDITVFIHDGVYHLFHLIIPNHDYIAHATSRDGISWQRVPNALFVGDPGAWDDDMLWTMHVVQKGKLFYMYYTGLHRRDRGTISRVGLAISEDLVHWVKTDRKDFLIAPQGVYYEAYNANPRQWLSFRDPFYTEHDGEEYLICCARTLDGPVSRRGCAGLVKITGGNIEMQPPLLFPMVYDDLECPCVFQLHNRFYLVASIREDIKVRYWYADAFAGEYRSFHADVLLPPGNYAARIVQDGEHLLIYNFFYAYGNVNALRVLPPPKQLDTDAEGRLLLKTYYRWQQMVQRTIPQQQLGTLKPILNNPTASGITETGSWACSSRSGYEIFCVPKPSPSFIWQGKLTVQGPGKLGLVCDIDIEGNGYFISFDIVNGIVQLRAWGFNEKDNRQNFIFNNIQSGLFNINKESTISFSLIRYGNYIELSVDGTVKLSLMDFTYAGEHIGLYTASSAITLQDSQFSVLPDPEEEYAGVENQGMI